MAGAQAAAPAAAGAQQQEQPGIMARLGGIFRMILIFQVIKYVTSPSRPTQTDPVTGQVVPSRNHPPLWKQDASFDLFVYTSEEKDDFTDFRNPNSLLWEQRGLSYDWNIQREENITITTTEHLLNNGSLWAHVFFVKDGHSADPNSKFYDPTAVAYSKIQMNAYRPRPKVHAKKKLLSGEYTDDRLVTENKSPEEIAAQTEAAPEWISLWKPMLSVRLVHDFTTFPPNYWPPPLNDFYKIEPESNAYYPVIFIDYFWLLRERWMPINETTPTLPLELSYSPISLLKFQFQLQMEHTWSTQNSLGMGQTEEETQEFKRMLLDTNPYFLGLTMVVSLLHMVFDFLAFKNDIQFWREDRSMEGLSVRTIGLNCICQVIIFLYLLDNETSWMIILSSGVGLLIEFWKITKAMNVKIDPTKWYRISFEDKAGYEQSGTAEYDRQAMRYLSWALYPLVIGYAIYSLMYNEHKSWYSWLLGSLTGAVYTFGFIMMCPQLYLNYKLKSVAHLPWRMLTYKALNTFIDDLFAFIIKMPTLHRLSCFRDDVVFFIYLYQRWIYKTDYTRVNEFGMRLAGSNPLPHEEQDVVPLTDGELNDMKSKLPPKVLHLIAEFVPPVKAEGHPPAAAGPTPAGAKAEVAASSQGQTTVSKRAGRKTRKE